jgi:hypothetical protein
VRLDAAHDRLVAPPRSKPSARAAENTVFSIRRSSSSPTSGAVWPRPFGYCSLTTRGTSRMRAACTSFAHALATPAKDSYGAKPSCTSTTTAPLRSRSSRLIRRPPSRTPARGRRRRRRRASAARGRCNLRPAKQQFSERLSQPCSPASTRRRGRRASGWPARPARSSGSADSNSAAPAVIRSTSSPSSSTPGSTRPVYSAANAVSRPVVPIGACSNGTSFSSRACGAWSVATQSIVPVAQALDQRLAVSSVASGGFIFMRVSIPRTSSSVSSRWCGRDLGADPPAARLRLRDGLRPRPRS